MQTRAVIFDLDGLMVDTEPLSHRALNLALARGGVSFRVSEEEYARVFVGVDADDAWFESRAIGGDHRAEILAEWDRVYDALIANPANLAPMPGLFTLLDRLQARGLRLGVASSTRRDRVEPILRALEIESRFQTVVTGSDVVKIKPAPDIYLCTMERLRVASTNGIAIEDSAGGIASAKAAGLRVIAVPNRFTARQDLSQADARAQSLGQVGELL